MDMLLVDWTVRLGILLMLQQMTHEERMEKTGSCQPHPSCPECIQSSPSCAWCKQLDFVQAGESDSGRCAPRSELEHRGCLSTEIMDPQGEQHILEDRPLSDGVHHGETITQLAPQRIALLLRPGKQQSFTVRFRRAEGHPVDLYYLMDLSYSMKDDLEKIKQLGNDILATLRKVTTSVKIGFGAFVDKTVLPYVDLAPSKLRNSCRNQEKCQPAFSYRHVLALTNNASEFESKVSQQSISANLDDAEGGFDAIMQAAICKEQIGWRNVTRLLVFTSDGTYHTAGDGKLGGVYMPNDGQCHLDASGIYTKSHLYDYPSIGHLSEVLSESNIQPIFAVTGPRVSIYKELSKFIPKSVVGELKSDSSNVVQLIADAYNNLSSTVNLEHSSDPPCGITITYDSHCGNSETYGQTKGGECTGVLINQLVQFRVNITAATCLPEPQKLVLRALGVGEEVQIQLSTVCECQCGDTQPDAHHCSDGHGNLTCGICRCHEGHIGHLCECSQEDLPDSEVVALCKCDNLACERHHGQLCAGNGLCRCGHCECQANYTGSACECSLETSGCTQGGLVCSGHGNCVCNQCQCEHGWLDSLCSRCTDCQTPCEEHRNCAECKSFGTGPLSRNCSASCNQTVRVLLAPVNERWCQMKAADGSLLIFLVEKDETGGLILTVNGKKGPDITQQIVVPVVLSVVSVVVLFLALFRGLVEMYDRREFRRFAKERKNAKWSEVDNPLFKSAITTIINPQYSGNESIANTA